MARPGAVNRPPPVTPQAVTVCPVSIQGSRPVTARLRAPTSRAVAVRRPRPHPARAGTRREPSGRRPESTLSTSWPRTGRGARATTTATSTSYSYVTWPSYPSMLHDPKIENHGRIIRGGKTTKSPSNSHVVERAVRIGERQRSRRRGKKEAYSERAAPTSPAPEGEGEAGARPRLQPRGTATPPAPPRSSGRGGSPPRPNTRCTLRPLPLPLPS